MNLKFYTIFLLAIVIGLASCRSAKKLYEKGDYDEAVVLAARKLQKKPNDANTLNLLRSAYTYAQDDHLRQISNYRESNSDLRWEWIYHQYADLQRLYGAIYSYPDVFAIVHPTDYSSELNDYREKAGEAHYERGLALMERGGKNESRQAYFEFRQAEAFLPGDLRIQKKMDFAMETAVTNVVVQPLIQTGFQFSSFNTGIAGFDPVLLQSLNNGGQLFVRYYSPAEALYRQIRVDQYVELRMGTVDIDRVREDHQSREISREVVIKEKIIRPDSVVRETAVVKGRLITTRKTVRAAGAIDWAVSDGRGQWLGTNTTPAEFCWSATTYRFNGDERALGPEEKKLLDCREPLAPSREELYRLVLADAQQKTIYAMRDYFSRY